jgi:hypothetical protein
MSKLESTLRASDATAIEEERFVWTRTLMARIERAQQASKIKARFPIDCICFPENEEPSFRIPSFGGYGNPGSCPLHGASSEKLPS